ncbi:hypothetical protein [Clostridium chrysemydis]|uniref:hypothetical protein n=1 Tax=Clostridium chrysemydis TaxID=2665504 RepID=UPI0018846C99|nr:hypothetical protein [Clostridium chrysemydis]
MNEHKEKLEKYLHLQKCPECNCSDIGIDNWDMFKGAGDWFYYCKDCDITFQLVIVKEEK